MIALFLIALVLAFLSLVLASQLPGPAWLWALDAVGVCVAVAALSGLGAVLSSQALLPLPGPRMLWLPLASAALALGTRGWLVDWLWPQAPVPRIDYWRLQLAAGSAVGAAFALVGGVAALSRGRAWAQHAAAGAIVAAGLYALGPLALRAGVPVDWRAFLGLAGLGLAAFAVVEASRRARRP